ncbi:longitudinals lacking protein, isoforms H/M/V-like isoform X2 [Leptidea sinapis]|uniref:longitudinals lacking protein, isoforms H/M/V-like isoform X2 n=1 Tax=Leptidea sinapis TaxID=189913 RepID=UPI0021C2977E|nr:longitudinals lacking protein, isoforms H/M/V-like isoform X2 [Leptidea sinapis]
MADQFCLRWNNFQSNIVSALDSLKCSGDLVDVTLTCEGKSIKAHKVILSACSPYFRNVFKENPCQHPVIILKDVSADDISSLLSYMYQGEVFIEESKLSSFLHTAALLQIKGLTGVTQQAHGGVGHKETKIPALKKRRSSTSDKPNDVAPDTSKKSKVETCETYNKNNCQQIKSDNALSTENNVERKKECRNESSNNDVAGIANGKNSQVIEDVAVVVKKEWTEENSSPNPASGVSDTESLPDYENSMLARSLLSGINPSKSDTCAKKTVDIHMSSRCKDLNAEVSKSPLKNIMVEESMVKSEKPSPKSDVEYEPEVLLSEQQDGTDSESNYTPESQALLMLAGMSSVPVNSGASTSQSVSHQSNHAAICGDCPHCGMKYSNQSALKYHVRLMHSDLTNRLCCYLCPRSFTMRETFKEHMWNSHGQRN